ncbi:hypothetical protein GNI_061320 [Gregarina niphandrodes]|uniref:Uncharacterized protein n=1 Tax=Gregarina niphandrodes TaxID=110365 RepID=A0A023B8F2_GRENI|nr:hypothetical protein GNI_061320 [Gregarina niphandrodes]EZG68840.1 hypothetical protein GNI_061320 [Gregarina niphandrodes]|eukprot:XP_011134549.1 hypothetical protein GNI_061320 [Gregarina niphandrodes]
MEKPSMEKPSMEKPSMEQSSMEQSSMEQPSMEQPSMEQPTEGDAAVERSLDGEPSEKQRRELKAWLWRCEMEAGLKDSPAAPLPGSLQELAALYADFHAFYERSNKSFWGVPAYGPLS